MRIVRQDSSSKDKFNLRVVSAAPTGLNENLLQVYLSQIKISKSNAEVKLLRHTDPGTFKATFKEKFYY